jgi:hypothetical protein
MESDRETNERGYVEKIDGLHLSSIFFTNVSGSTKQEMS